MEAASLPPVTVASVASFVGTLAGVVLLIGVLLAFDLVLMRIDRRESARHAAAEYETGRELLRAGRPSAAADHFAAALVIARDSVSYALALGQAQRQEGRSNAAEATLKALLDRAENDGAVNLAMARVLAEQGRVAEAKSYFHRAIYGRWGADSIARRAEARFALIDFLAAHGGGRDLLAELLPLEDVPPDSLLLRKRLGGWFLLADSPARAANMFREVIHRDPRDGEAYAGMGEAALAQGNFRTARADFAAAASLLPGDGGMAPRIALADTLISADPTARGIGAAEREMRGRALLTRMLSLLDQCVTARPRPVSEAARGILADTTGVRLDTEMLADSVTTLATDLWSSYGTTCTSRAADHIVDLLGVRLAQ
jgi:tetratricopeptide (TPR) repeat protein